jgi:hypothetical protein
MQFAVASLLHQGAQDIQRQPLERKTEQHELSSG